MEHGAPSVEGMSSGAQRPSARVEAVMEAMKGGGVYEDGLTVIFVR